MFEKCWKCTKIKLMAWDLRMPNEVKMHSTWNSWFKNFARSTLSARTASGLHLLSIHLKEFRLVFSSLLSAIFLAVFGATMEKLQWIWAVQCHVETLFMHFVDTEWSENVCKGKLRWLQSIGACRGLELLATWEIPANVQWIATVKTEANWLQRKVKEYLHHCFKNEFRASKPG